MSEPPNTTKIVIAFRKAETRKNKVAADKCFDQLWEVCQGPLRAYTHLHRYVGPKWPLDDLLQTLRLGLLRAAREYDATRGASFLECACFMARREMLIYIGEYNDTIRQSPYLTRSRKVLTEYREALALALGREPTDSEVESATFDLRDARMVRFAAAHPVIGMADYDVAVLFEVSGNVDPCFEAALASEQRAALRTAWLSWMGALTSCQAERMTALYGRGADARTHEQAAEVLGCTPRSIDNGTTLGRAKLRSLAETLLAEQGLTIATASIDDILALQFPTFHLF